ncbi:AAA family ATPase [Nitrosomonas sp. Nm34]|uniref:AAA family ATPase n=1 Tax=Nitrosomonas sp. Nm34 TaxID=1881055 RepID=UPI0008E10CCA|nr:AAA family ATPase [Nitrosomonas sp. Nm34]SFI74873.1 AAA domain-containing protein [Nitrosomonas sp. Nm34]
MKIKQIIINNFLAVRNLQASTDKPIFLFAGNNEAGKSTIADACAMAMLGYFPRGIGKRDGTLLLNNKANDASIEIYSEDVAFSQVINRTGLMKGTKSENPALPFVLDIKRFSKATSEERSKLLFEISGTKITPQVVREKMKAAGLNLDYAEPIIPIVIASFSEAQKEAQARAREAKAQWKTVTGETYGDKKAPEWKASKEGNLEALQDEIIGIKKELSIIESELEASNQQYGALKQAKDKAGSFQEEMQKLQEQVDSIPRIKKKKDCDEQSVTSWLSMIENIKNQAGNISPADTVSACPSCGTELVFVAAEKKLIERGDMHGDQSGLANLPKYQQALETSKNAVANDERDLRAAENTQTKLELMKSSLPEFNEVVFASIVAKIDELKATKKELSEQVSKLEGQERNLREADSKTEQAMKYHLTVAEYEKIAAALSPLGIPGEFQNETSGPFVDRVQAQAAKAGWKIPEFDNDFRIWVNGCAYECLSESAQWRVDVLISEAISHMSELKFFVVDRFDLLDNDSRSDYLYWLSELAILGEVDTVLTMGTLKRDAAQLIAGAIENVSVNWIESGQATQIS